MALYVGTKQRMIINTNINMVTLSTYMNAGLPMIGHDTIIFK